MATREWHAVAFDTTGVTEPRASMFKISRTLSLLPSLTRDVRAYFASSSAGTIPPSSSSSTRLSLLRRAERLHKMLDEVKPYIDATLADPQRVQRVAAAAEHAHLWPEAYRFADAGVAFVLWFFWNMRMISSAMIVGLHRHDSNASSPFSPSSSTASSPASPSSSSSSSSSSTAHSRATASRVAALERDIHRMARAVCMSWEHARAVRPLGAMYIDVGLIVAYSAYAGSPERRRWVLRALEELTEGSNPDGPGEGFIAGRTFEGGRVAGGGSGSGNKDWSAERVAWLGRWFTAGCVDYVGAGEDGDEGDAGSSPLFGGCGAVGGVVESAMTASPTVMAEGRETTSPELQSSLWDEWAFAAAGGQDFVDWDVSMSSSDDMSFRADSTYGGGAVRDGEPLASASTATGSGGRAWSPDSLASSLADTDSFLVLQPMGMRVRWPTTMMTTTTTPTNNGRNYGFDNLNSFSSTLNSRSFVA